MTETARRGAERTPLGAVRYYAYREWKTLARMRTAVILLAIIAGLSIIATLVPQRVHVDSFNATYYDNGKPKDFVSHVVVLDQGRKVTEKDIRVNQYLEYKDVKFYQANYGWAPVIQVTDPAVPIIWFSFALMLGGLIVRLYLAPLLKLREDRARQRAASPAAPVPSPPRSPAPLPSPSPAPAVGALDARPSGPGAASQSTSG